MVMWTSNSMENHSTSRTRRGFSLVEMIVVMGIISLLISILLPTLVTAKRHAEQVKCASNLRQIGIAFIAYANANQGTLPAWSAWHTWPRGTSDDTPGNDAWTIELIPYIGGNPDSPIYNCPSFRSKTPLRNYFLAAQWSGHSGKHSMKLSDITMTSRFVLSGEKTQRGLYPPPFGTGEHLTDDADPDDFGNGLAVMAWPWQQGGFYMHRNGNNVLFDDTHVALYANYDPLSMTFNPHRMEDYALVTPN